MPGVSFTFGFSPPPAVAPGPILFLISAAMVMKACSTLVAFLALVSKKGIPRESANSWTQHRRGKVRSTPFTLLSIHTSSSADPGPGHGGSSLNMDDQTFPSTGYLHTFRFFQKDPKANESNIVTPEDPGSSTGAPHSGACLNTSLERGIQEHLKQMPKPP